MARVTAAGSSCLPGRITASVRSRRCRTRCSSSAEQPAAAGGRSAATRAARHGARLRYRPSIVRPTRLVAGAALTAALALGALPGICRIGRAHTRFGHRPGSVPVGSGPGDRGGGGWRRVVRWHLPRRPARSTRRRSSRSRSDPKPAARVSRPTVDPARRPQRIRAEAAALQGQRLRDVLRQRHDRNASAPRHDDHRLRQGRLPRARRQRLRPDRLDDEPAGSSTCTRRTSSTSAAARRGPARPG